MTRVSWVTLKTTPYRWEADLITQILTAHEIPVQVLNCTGLPCLGGQGEMVIRVPVSERWTALLLVSPTDEDL
jgi:hypothetical protein